MREGVPDRLDPVRRPTTSWSSAAKGRVVELHERGDRERLPLRRGRRPGEQLAGGLGAFFLLTEPPERFGLPAQADSPIQENGPVANLAGRRRGVGAAAGPLASVSSRTGGAR